MKKAFVFIENQAFNTLLELAARTRERGYTNLLIFRKMQPHEKERLNEYEQQHRHPLFEQICEVERWDYSRLRDLVEEMAGKQPLAGILTVSGLFTADGLLGASVAQIASEKGLPSQSVDGLYRSNNKYLTRDALRHAGLQTVDFGLATEETSLIEHARRIGYPVILKPINGCASQLVIKCENEQELLQGYRSALKKLPRSIYRDLYACTHRFADKKGNQIIFDPLRTMLVEKYIEGPEASIEIVATESDVIPLLVHDKVLVSEGDRVVYEHLLVVPPVRFTQEELENIRRYAVEVAKATGIKNSLCHVEIRYDKHSGPQLLEINPRVGGMLVTKSLETMIGFHALDAMVDLALGSFQPRPYPCTTDQYGMFTLYPPHAGYFERVEGLDKLNRIPGILSSTLLFPEGTQIHGDDEEVFLLMCWVKGQTYEEIRDIYEQAKREVRFHVKKEAPAR